MGIQVGFAVAWGGVGRGRGLAGFVCPLLLLFRCLSAVIAKRYPEKQRAQSPAIFASMTAVMIRQDELRMMHARSAAAERGLDRFGTSCLAVMTLTNKNNDNMIMSLLARLRPLASSASSLCVV
jgi:ABC-type transport system involved in cytochrome bd biosynthesis fused ATPase/permease subunit